MAIVMNSGQSRHRTALVLGALLVLSLPGGVAVAANHAWVTPDGREIPLTRSGNEWAVTFRSHAEVVPCSKRLAARGLGVVSDFRFSEASLTKRLEAVDASLRRRDLIRRDPAVTSVRRMYRLRESGSPLVSTGTFNVRVREDLTDQELDTLWRDYGVEVVEPVAGLRNTFLVQPGVAGGDEVVAARALAHDDRTVWAQPNFRAEIIPQQIAPADEFFSRQWYLQDAALSGDGISALGAWTTSQGQDVLIGMLDDACDVDHSDLRANYFGVGHDITVLGSGDDADQADPSPSVFGDRHGTAVMGVAVARGNTVGGRGVAFQSRFTASRGLNELPTFQEIASAYTFALQQDVDVHINSWSLPADQPNPSIIVDALTRAARDGRDPNPNDDEDVPFGMIIVFASGDGIRLNGGNDLPTGQDFTAVTDWEGLFQLDSVIGVGATDGLGRVAEYSNFAEELDLLAPGGTGELGILTTDNRDNNPDRLIFSVDDGFNVGGLGRNTAEADVDTGGDYTENFFGTSASCPMVAGVAALVISANPTLLASDVRIILEHSADRINPTDANYDNVSGRSRTYGYGRVNAAAAVQAASDARVSGGRAWPERPTESRLDGGTLSWNTDQRATEFLVVQSIGGFTFDNEVGDRFPQDGACYSVQQIGCAQQQDNLAPLPSTVEITAVVPFDELTRDDDGTCDDGCTHTMQGLTAGGGISYAVIARNGISRYSWGAVARLVEDNGGGGSNGSTPTGPRVTIMASLTEGQSPLTVVFTGNAQATTLAVDDNRAVWDFDTGDDTGTDALSRNATWTYEAAAGEIQTFTARLTMFDVDGNPGFAEIQITVEGPAQDEATGGGSSSIRIVVGIPGSVDSDVAAGLSPFAVQLSIDASDIGSVQSIVWDLGDGTTSTSLVVPHTYVNETSAELRIPITANVTSSGRLLTATRLITVFPGTAVIVTGDPTLDGAGIPDRQGTSAVTCGALGVWPVLLTAGCLCFARRRRRTYR